MSLLEFGIPEAMWKLHVHDFMAIVTMDAHGNSLHAEVERETGEQSRIVEDSGGSGGYFRRADGVRPASGRARTA